MPWGWPITGLTAFSLSLSKSFDPQSLSMNDAASLAAFTVLSALTYTLLP